MLSLSLPWVITSHISLILCKIETLNDQHPTIAVSLTVEAKLQWTATVAMKIYPCTCTSLFHLPHPIQAVEDIYCVMRFFSIQRRYVVSEILMEEANLSGKWMDVLLHYFKHHCYR